jgi:hypothetical protein
MKPAIWFKRGLLATLSAGTSAVIAACYGVFMDDYEVPLVDGQVTDRGEGVEGLEVCATFPGELALDSAACTESASGGYFGIDGEPDLYDRANAEGFLLTVRDVDGEANGSYEPVAIAIDPGMVPLTQDIEIGDELSDDDDDSAL